MTSPLFLDDELVDDILRVMPKGELLVVTEKPRSVAVTTFLLNIPFVGWFLGLIPALKGAGFVPYGWTWGLTAPFFGWFVGLYLLYVWDGP